MAYDFYVSLETYRSSNLEVDVFMKFLDEEYNTDQLSFMLLRQASYSVPSLIISLAVHVERWRRANVH